MMKLYVSSNTYKTYPILDIQIITDHPIFHTDFQHVAAAVDVSILDLPNGPVISKDRNKITQQMVDDFESFVLTIEDLCEEVYGLVGTYKNVSDDHSHYYNYIATNANGEIIVDLRLRLRISNHPSKRSNTQKQHKKEELLFSKLQQLLSEQEISRLMPYVKLITINDELFEIYEEAMEHVDSVIEHAVESNDEEYTS